MPTETRDGDTKRRVAELRFHHGRVILTDARHRVERNDATTHGGDIHAYLRKEMTIVRVPIPYVRVRAHVCKTALRIGQRTVVTP